MATYSATVTSPRSPEDVFAYLADFRTVAEWDPSINSSTLLTPGEPRTVGARFKVVQGSSIGSDVELEYEIQSVDAPRQVVLRGENDSLISIDTITVEPADGGGCAVTYDAEIELKGARKVADPLMQLGLKRLGNKAKDGLAEKLAT